MSKITTAAPVRLSYTYLLTPRAQNDGDEPTFSTALLIPKSDTATIEAIKGAIAEALTDGVSKLWGGKRPGNLRNPLRDGDADRPGDEVYAGHYFLNAKGPRGGKEQPIMMGADGEETSSQSVIYSGVNARVSLQFYPYDKNGNRGVACGISAVLSTGKGEALGNTVTVESARDEFGVKTPAGSAKAEFAESGSTSKAAASDDDDDVWGS
jgi:Protein of unknown function (DUF2815).